MVPECYVPSWHGLKVPCEGAHVVGVAAAVDVDDCEQLPLRLWQLRLEDVWMSSMPAEHLHPYENMQSGYPVLGGTWVAGQSQGVGQQHCLVLVAEGSRFADASHLGWHPASVAGLVLSFLCMCSKQCLAIMYFTHSMLGLQANMSMSLF